MQTIIPQKLKKGDGIRIITPARSLMSSFIAQEIKDLAVKRLEELGLIINFGKHVNEIDDFSSSSIKSRIEDLHDAFRDPSIKLILSVIGGFNSNQLLNYIDYDLIKNNPKILCGYSDITALANAIYAKTGIVTYSGPHFFNFGDQRSFDYTLEYFQKCFFNRDSYKTIPSLKWSDDLWANNQANRTFYDNEGYWIINEGKAEGTIIGANLCTFNLLQGTEFMPSLKNAVLFLEDDSETRPHTFDRDLQSLIHQPNFEQVKGIVIGRFQKESGVTRDLLTEIIRSKKELSSLPIIANADFGHTTPMMTFPIGGTVQILAMNNKPEIEIIKH